MFAARRESRRFTTVGLGAAVAVAVTAAMAPPLTLAAGAADTSTGHSPTVVEGSLDVVGWDDQLVGESQPLLSWVIEDEDRGEAQSAYQVEVLDADGDLVWDSGKVADAASTLRPYQGTALSSGADYRWQVRVWDSTDLASAWSAPTQLQTGLLDAEDWSASWITVPSTERARTDFEVDTEVSRAVLYYAAWGNVRARINGQPVSEETLGTTWTDWTQRVLYRGADVTDLVQEGDNALALTVGATLSAPSTDLDVMAQLEITDADGLRYTAVGTDGTWQVGSSPITKLDTYLGESFDARLETPGWDEPGFDPALDPAGAWTPASVVSPVTGATLLSGDAVVTAKDAVVSNGWSLGAINDGVLTSTDASEGYHSATTTDPDETKWVQLDLGSSVSIGSVTMYGASPTNDPAGSNPGAGFPVRYRIEVSDDDTFETSTVVVDHTDADQANPGVTPVTVDTDVEGRYLRVTATKLALSSGSYNFRLAELQVRGTDDGSYALSPLQADPTPLTRAVDSIAPVSVETVASGVQLYDFGQNYAGWVQLTATAPAGTTATLYLGEILDDDGRVTTSNIDFAAGETQRQTYDYTFAGDGEETWEPLFVYSGFRYAELSGLPAGTEVTLRARPVHTDLTRTSTLDTDDAMLSAIDTAVRQSQLNAAHGIPEDTPTREKKGWAGDALAGASSIMTAFDADDFYRKYLGDLQTSIFDDGGVASVAPSRQFGREFKVDPAWGAAYPGIAWEDYLQEGDARVLAQHYQDFLGWLDYLAGISDDDHIVVNPEVSYGEDWLATVSTPPALFHTLYYLKDVRIVADAARVLGYLDDATELDALAAEIADGVNSRFLDTETADYSTGTQFANAFPLLLGIVPAELEDQVLANLIGDIQARGNHLTSGFVGTQLIIQTLHAVGRDDVILDTALRDDYPSLGYMVANGPGTIWEKWVDSSASDGTSSKDHPALGGGLEEWFYRGLAGITPLEPGYQRIRLAVPDLPEHEHAAASVQTPLGTVSSDWTRTDDGLDYQVTVPVGATAEVVVPAATTWAVTEGGVLLDDVLGVEEVQAADGAVTITVGSGTYDFVVTAGNDALGLILDQVQALRDDAIELAADGDLSTSVAADLDEAVAGVGDDVEDGLLAAIGGDDATVSTELASALDRLAALQSWLADATIDTPVKGRLADRLTALETALSQALASALGVSV
ncbi:MAG: family 78 glycoside hydrolase catalytic domain, partial [Nocardioidaceae bacterium]